MTQTFPQIISPPAVAANFIGLSATVSTANAVVNIGNSITIPKTGKLKIYASGYVSGGYGNIDFIITRNGLIIYAGGTPTIVGASLAPFGSTNTGLNFNNTEPILLQNILTNMLIYYAPTTQTELLATDKDFYVVAGDVLQFRASNNTANDTTYITFLLVIVE